MLSTRRACLLALLILAIAAVPFPRERAHGQTALPTPTADEIEIFRSLTPEQQEAILRQLGTGTGAAGAAGGLGGRGAQSRNRLVPAEAEQQRQSAGTSEELSPTGLPLLKGEDSVIIEIDFHLPPRQVLQPTLPLTASSASLQAALQGAGSTVGNNVAPGQTPQLQSAVVGQEAAQQQGSQNAEPLSEQERRTLTDMMTLIRANNPYQLSRDGVLNLPGFPPIALLGLTEEQATLRLQTEPAFRNVQIRLTRLPLKRTGPQGLQPFGYDLFDRPPSTFAPVTDVPVPADYVVGPGDELVVQLYGNQNRVVTLVVSRDGRINFPEIGPVNVAGRLFDSVRSDLEARVARQMIGVRASVSMGDTRSIRVFVVGEAKRPGTYVVSGLGTVTSALFAAGGVKPIGSLRKIQLKRQGAVVRTLDLYDVLLRGDTTDDSKLLPGDVILVPPVGPTVAVDGEVRRPAIYEIRNESTVADAIGLAGGLTPEADRTKATLTRIDDTQRRVVLQIEPGTPAASAQGVRNGDVLQIARLRPTLDSGVLVQGHVFAQGVVAYRDGLRLSDAIHSIDELQPNADIHYLLIRRELPPDRRVAVVSADLAAALRAPGSSADILLMPRDRITVFDLVSSRDRVIQSLMRDLKLQSSMEQPSEIVHVDGRVKVPGDYPLESTMTVADLVRAGGGLSDEAYGSTAELTRYQVDGATRRTQLIEVDLAAALRGDPAANVRLMPFDFLSIKEIPGWSRQESVSLTGEVRFPGRYSIRRGETLRSVISRAGGLSEYAFPEGAVFTREELKRREQEQIDLLANRMQRDLAVLALQGAAANQAGAPAALSVGQQLLGQLRSTKSVGRLVIDLPRAMSSAPGSASDVILRNGDELIIPRFQQEVTVIGEVQNSTSHLFRPELGRDDYIALSGGMSNRADHAKIYVVRANGSVVASSGSRWFQTGGTRIKPGDTIVVPLDTERMPALPFWQAVTSILYNVAISAAAVHSF